MYCKYVVQNIVKSQSDTDWMQLTILAIHGNI